MRIFIVVACALLACEAPKKNDAPAPASSCTKFGQTCELSPGKLGTCVEKPNCTTDCLTCQSQH
jgi:hypothetical protein